MSPQTAEYEILRDNLPEKFQLLNFQFDILAFAQILEPFGILHAPDELICDLTPIREDVTLAFYSKDGKIFAANVTEALMSLK